MKNFKIFASSLLTGLALNSVLAVNASAKKAESSSLEMYNKRTKYDLEMPIDVILPTDIKISKDGSQKYTYSTVTLEFSKKTINPTEIVDIMRSIDLLEDKSKDDKYVYLDKNEASFPGFRINKLTGKKTEKQFNKYLSDKNKEYEEEREDIDHSKYAEFMLPILNNYSYLDARGRKSSYSANDYMYFYLPYDKLSNDTDLADYAELVYSRYQSANDHVVTYDEIKAEQEKEKTKTKK